MTTPAPAPPDGDPKREARNRGLKLRKLADRKGYDARQASGAWRIFGDGRRRADSLCFHGDIDGAERYLVDRAAAVAVLRVTRHETA